MSGVSAMIHSENPDIVALVEYFPGQREPLHPLLVPDYPYFAICTGGRRANLALYARLPFTVAPGDPCDWDADGSHWPPDGPLWSGGREPASPLSPPNSTGRFRSAFFADAGDHRHTASTP